MKYIALPADTGQRRLSFYLAMEEYVARSSGEPEAFFLWQVRPTVIFGRNQSMQGEVNVDYCRTHGIEMYRRKSGGGCVYANEQNLMLSLATSQENVGLAFNQFINMVLLVLRKLGIEGTGTAHNDVLINGLKVSGTACYQLPGVGSIVHGTLLYDTNMEHMLNAITPPQEKLQKRGIESVRQRITLLHDHLPQLQMDGLKATIRTTLCKGERMLTTAEVAEIERIENTYLKEEFIHLLP